MIGIDTNVLIRWNLAEDTQPNQASLARQAIENSEDPIFINTVVLAESIWVISNAYRISRPDQAAFVRSLLDHAKVMIAERGAVEFALNGFQKGGPGFADHLIAALNVMAGCQTTLTFDRIAAKGPHFTVLT